MFGFNKKEKYEQAPVTVSKEGVAGEAETTVNTAATITSEADNKEQKSADRFSRFCETRMYLHQIKDCKHRIKLLGDRKDYRESANLDASRIEDKISAEKVKMIDLRVEISDEISKLNEVRLEWVMVKRYVDCLSWEEIAVEIDTKVRTVQKLHGRALPLMKDILVADGKITEDDSVASFPGVVGRKSHDYNTHDYFDDSPIVHEEEPHEYFND